MRSLLASPLGFLIGLSLGALGGGGSILAVPALVYAAGQDPKAATTTSLVLVTITALVGIIPHWRAGHVRLAAGTVFGLAGIGGSLVGSAWNEAVDADVLLLAFSVLMLVAAYAMWQRLRKQAAAAGAPAARSVGAAAASPERLSTDPDGTSAIRLDLATAVKVVIAGSFIGLLTGFFGVGGGFVIVPALVLALGFSMPDAVGTSLIVIAVNSTVALTTRLPSGSIEWGTVIPFTVASLIGVFVGSRLASTRDPSFLQRWFVILLVVVALYTATSSLIALF
ncbi:MAG TPA: sulfite exporter TauE/SafE family protein [Ilumatobacteraceae bacterium]|nr:sulfite exporter TauE/SafE family protein [Ilumatobacteraceae bacterium]